MTTRTKKPPARLVRKALAELTGLNPDQIGRSFKGNWNALLEGGRLVNIHPRQVAKAEAKAAAKPLRGRGGASTLGGSSNGAKPLGRKRNEPSPDTYSGRIALRLRRLREQRGWTVKELHAELTKRGHTVPVSSLYAYECGRKAGGVDLPHDLYPAMAEALGVNVRTMLPAS